MHTLVMILQASWFAIEVLVLLSLLGFGLTAWLLPQPGIGMLLTPVVGLALAGIGFQLFTPIVPPWITLLVLLVLLGGFSLSMAWRRRAVLVSGIRQYLGAIAFTAAAGLTLYLALLVHVFGARFFTLAGWPSDNVFLYAPASEFLKTHAFNALNPLSVVNNPVTVYLGAALRVFPNSVGPIDAAISAVSGWPVMALFDPLSAFFWALAVPAMYVLLEWLGLSRPARIAAVLLLIANQLLFWVMGLSNQQEMQAMPIFLAALALTIQAVSSDRRGTAVLAGLVGGSLLGLYLPVFVIFVFTAVGYTVVVTTMAGLAGRLLATLRQLVFIGGSGTAAAAAAIFWLLPAGGLHTWLSYVNTRIPAGNINFFYPPRYLLGMAPVADPWGLPFAIRPLWWRPAWNTVSQALALVVVALIVAGLTSFALRRNWPAIGLFAAAGLYLAYLRLGAQFPYGYIKTVSFLAPLTSALIAAGALELVPAIRERVKRQVEFGASRLARLWATALVGGVACLLVVLAVEALNSVEMEHLWLRVGPQAFPASFRALAGMAAMVPRGSGVLEINPSPAYHEGIKYAAARVYLTDDNLLLEDHVPAAAEVPFRVDFLILPWPPDTVAADPGFRRVWSDPDVGLALYQRQAGSG
jgi:hypothetical protein